MHVYYIHNALCNFICLFIISIQSSPICTPSIFLCAGALFVILYSYNISTVHVFMSGCDHFHCESSLYTYMNMRGWLITNPHAFDRIRVYNSGLPLLDVVIYHKVIKNYTLYYVCGLVDLLICCQPHSLPHSEAHSGAHNHIITYIYLVGMPGALFCIV